MPLAEFVGLHRAVLNLTQVGTDLRLTVSGAGEDDDGVVLDLEPQ